MDRRAATFPLQSGQPPDFSLTLGGPVFQLFRRSHLSGDALELLHRRLLVITAVVWLPLLLLSMLGARALSGTDLPFLRDIEAQVRLLVALPVLIIAELVVHRRVRETVQSFLTRRLVRPEEVSKFVGAVQSATTLRNSVPVELGLLLLVYTVGLWHWRSQIALASSTWYASVQDGRLQLTMAGYWYVFVSVPIFQFILLRWYLRLLIWFRFLWQVARLSLVIIPTHPDRAGGLAFLGKGAYAFGPILFAEGALLAGLIASRVLYGGEPLSAFRVEGALVIGFFLLIVLGPLVMFMPQLARAKRRGLAEYGLLASRYVEQFEQKWVGGRPATDEELLGSSDIQSLADLGNSYAVVREMRPVPFGLEDMLRLTAATAVPLLPLGLIVFSFEELVTRLLQVMF